MKKLKKLITLVAAMCMIFSMATVVFAEDEIVSIYGDLTYDQTIAAGETVKFEAYGVGGTTLTINDESAVVIYEGEEYEAVEGVVEVAVTSTNPRMPVSFQVRNDGEVENTYTIEFVFPLGSMDNPETFEGASSVYAQIEAGNNQGYFINFIAPADGLFSFTIYGAEDAEYNELGWSYTLNRLTESKYGDKLTSADEVVESSQEFEVSEGDEIQIIVSTYDPEDMWNIPAGAVSAYIDFVYPIGSAENPIFIEETPCEMEIMADSHMYYQGYFAGQTVTISSDKVSVVYKEQTYTAENGIITIECPAQGMGRPMPDVFVIKNDGTEDVTIAVDSKYPVGHMENPDKLVAGTNKATVEAGNMQGYYFIWTATENGILKVTFDEKADWMYTVNNMTTYEYGDTVWSDSDPAMPSTFIAVNKGDEIQVVVNTYDPEDMWNYPAGTVEFSALIITEKDVTDIVGTEDDVEFNESAEVKNNADGTELVVSDISVDDFVTIFELAQGEYKDVLKDYYLADITLEDAQGNVVQPEAGKTVDITLKVPAQIKDAKLIEVFWLDGDKLESLGKCEVKDGKFTFGAKHFSAYVFADVTPVVVPDDDDNSGQTPTPTPTPTPGDGGQQVKPGDSANVLMLFALAAIAGAVVLTKKKTVTE